MKPEDRAQELELKEWEARQASGRLLKPSRPSARVCECGARIPAARRKAVPGVQTCIECQEFNEQTKGRYGTD